MDFAEQFGRRVRLVREAHGVSQSELAREAQVGANYIPRIERGEMVPSVEAAWRIAKVLGVSLDELCGKPPGRKPAAGAVERSELKMRKADAAVLRRVAVAIEASAPKKGARR